MRRIIMVGSIMCAGALLLSASSSSTRDEYYGAADVSATSAGHLEGFGCGMGPAGFTTDSRVTISESGNATLVCKTETATGPDRALQIKDVGCGVPLDRPPFFVVTTNTHLIWSPSGQATLVCNYKS